MRMTLSQTALTQRFLPSLECGEERSPCSRCGQGRAPTRLPLFQISCHLGKMYSEMIFVNGFVHCDPHPGNILVRRHSDTGKAEIVLLDHGLYQVGENSAPSRVWSPLTPSRIPADGGQITKVAGSPRPNPTPELSVCIVLAQEFPEPQHPRNKAKLLWPLL